MSDPVVNIHRDLRDGAFYRLTAAAPGYTTITARDADGDTATPCLDRADVRRLIDDLTLVAGLAPSAPAVGRAAALAGSVRRIFELLGELEKTDGAAADEIVAAIAAHLRSWRPLALVPGGVP